MISKQHTRSIPADQMVVGQYIDLATWGDDDVNGAFIVKQVTPQYVHLWRPYIHAETFIYTGGILCFTGINEATISRDSREYRLVKETACNQHAAEQHNPPVS